MARVAGAERAPIGTIILGGVASLLYALMLANLIDTGDTDAAGRGLNQAFAALVGLLLWIVLAILLVIAAAKGRMPFAGIIAAVILLPASAVGAFAAASLYDGQQAWPILVVALLPPLIAFYAIWARLPQLHPYLPPLSTGLAIGSAIVVLTVLPLGVRWYQSLPDPARNARLAAEQKVREMEERRRLQDERDREEAAFARLGPDSSLGDYLEYLHGEHAQDALQGIRLVKSRQADAVALLQHGRLRDLAELRDFNLEATPELCAAYGAALASAAAQVSPKMRTDYLSAAIDLEWQLPNMRWLVGARCDLSAPLGVLETNVRAVADSERMTKFADTLAKLRATK